MIFWNCVASTRIEIVWYPWADKVSESPDWETGIPNPPELPEL